MLGQRSHSLCIHAGTGLIGLTVAVTGTMAAISSQGLADAGTGNRCEAVKAQALSGVVEARFELGVLYRQGGDGCPQDDMRSYFWLDLAAHAGYEAALPARDQLAEILSLGNIQKIEQAEHAWLACQQAHGVCAEPVAVQGFTGKGSVLLF